MQVNDLEAILDRMERIDGFFHRSEGHLLYESALASIRQFPDHALVEVGSYCGRSTSVLGEAIKSAGGVSKVYAIDPHEGDLSYPDGLRRLSPTLSKFKDNIAVCGLENVVELIRKKSFEVIWDRPIGLLLIDGLHDYENVARDFNHFERWVVEGGRVAFHDVSSDSSADGWPGVTKCVNEVLRSGRYVKENQRMNLMVMKKVP